MPWSGFLKKLLTPIHKKESVMGKLISLQNIGRPVWTPRDYQSLSDEGYMRNVIA